MKKLLCLALSLMLALLCACGGGGKTVYDVTVNGKLCTVVVESSMMVMMLFPGLPDGLGNAIISLCAATMVFSFVLYLVNYARMLRKSVK